MPHTLTYEQLQELSEIVPAIRCQPEQHIDPRTDDMVFMINDVKITDEKHADADADEDNDVLQFVVYITGNTKTGDTILVRHLGYRPFYYLSMPENESQMWADDLMEQIRVELQEDTWALQGLVNYEVVMKHPAVGFRNDLKMPFLKMEFKYSASFYKYREILEKLYPKPTPDQISHGIYLNDVILCEAYDKKEEVRVNTMPVYIFIFGLHFFCDDRSS